MKPGVGTNALAVLTVMGDRYNTLPSISRYVQKNYAHFKYPTPTNADPEEILRQKIVIFYHTDQIIRFAAATKDLILRGSKLWSGGRENNPVYQTDMYQTAWWSLPAGLEGMLVICFIWFNLADCF